jgi:hypothetical protein
MTDTILIDFEDITLPISHKETIWDIENKEKLQLIEFIERRIMSKIKPIFDEKDKKIDKLEKMINVLNNDSQIKINTLENEVTLLKKEISKQSKKIETTENKVSMIKEKCNEFSINVSNNLEEISGKVNKNSFCLSNQHIYLDETRELRDSIISIGSKEIYLCEYLRNLNFTVAKPLEQIECLFNLNKITLHGPPIMGQKCSLDEQIFKMIKNSYVKILVIRNCVEWQFVSSLPIIISNMPNLEKLEMIEFNDIDGLVDNLSKTIHNLKEIKFTNCYGIDITKIKEYCIRCNVELVII